MPQTGLQGAQLSGDQHTLKVDALLLSDDEAVDYSSIYYLEDDEEVFKEEAAIKSMPDSSSMTQSELQ